MAHASSDGLSNSKLAPPLLSVTFVGHFLWDNFLGQDLWEYPLLGYPAVG